MTWNYRVIRRENENGDRTYQIHEVYYDEAGRIELWTADAVEPSGESLAELREDCLYFLQAFRQPVLVERTIDGKTTLRPDEETVKTNPGHGFELMDRAFVALHHVQEHIGNHPVTPRDPELGRLYKEISERMAEFYTRAGHLWHEREG